MELNRFEAELARAATCYCTVEMWPSSHLWHNGIEIADCVAFTKVSGSCYPSQLPRYLFACDLACLSYADNISARRVPSSLSSVIVHFNDVDREYFWVWIIDRDEVVKCDAVVVDVAR